MEWLFKRSTGTDLWEAITNRQRFNCTQRMLCMHGLFYAFRYDVASGRYNRIPSLKEAILRTVEDNTSVRTRDI